VFEQTLMKPGWAMHTLGKREQQASEPEARGSLHGRRVAKRPVWWVSEQGNESYKHFWLH
jgi:hypothetical protein